VFVHADARDLVERPVGELAVVADADLDPSGQARPLDALARRRGLGLRRRDADPAHAVALRGVQQQRAPAAADVQQPLAGRQLELGADQLELARLGCLQRLAGVREVRARIHQARAEQQPVEAVGEVVVMADRGAVARERVPAAARAHLDRRDRRAPEDPGAADLRRRLGQPRAIGGGEVEAGERSARRQHGFQVPVVDVQRARHPGARQADLAGLVEQVRDRGGVLDRDHGGGAIRRRERAAVPEAQRHGKPGPAARGDAQRGQRAQHPERGSAADHRAGGARGPRAADVTILVKRLEERGWVARDRHAGDGRVVLVSITPAGRAALEDFRAQYQALLREQMAALPDAEVAALADATAALERLVETLQRQAAA
jgi:hypothetical protein